MTVITDITELIGNTPLLRLKNFDVPEGVAVYAKLACSFLALDSCSRKNYSRQPL